MELAHWFVAAITVLPDGGVSLGHAMILDTFPSRAACEAALEEEFDRGYSAGYFAHRQGDALQLVLQRSNGRDVMQCISPWSGR